MIATHSDYATACSARMGARLKRKQFFALQLNNLIFRGVAQLVARQFRVLEAASSSPATSTKKEQTSLAVVCSFFLLVEVVLPRARLCAKRRMRVRISRSKIDKLACQAKSKDIFAKGENPAKTSLAVIFFCFALLCKRLYGLFHCPRLYDF